MVHCSKCGTKIIGEEKVCTNCGATLGIIEENAELNLLEESLSKPKRTITDEIMTQVIKIFTKPVSGIEALAKEWSSKTLLIHFVLLCAACGLLLLMFSKGIYLKVENILTSVPLLSNMDSVMLEHSAARLISEGALLSGLFASALTVLLFLIGRFLFDSKTEFLVQFKAVVLSSLLMSGGVLAALMISYLEIQLGVITFLATIFAGGAAMFGALKKQWDISEDEAFWSFFISNIMLLIFLYIALTIFLK